MANKKITQLETVDTAIGIGSESMFPIASGSPTDTYLTSKVSSVDVAKYVLNPMPVGGSTDLSSIGFTGDSDIKFKKTNWVDASQSDVHNYPFLQVRKSDGLLVTGSGVAFDSATVPWNFIATDDITMQGNDITGLGSIGFGNVNTVPGLGRSKIAPLDVNGTSLQLLGYQDLTLSGNRHVRISGQALDLSNTPISGDVTFNGDVTVDGGDVEIDRANKLITNEIQASGSVGYLASIDMTYGAIKPFRDPEPNWGNWNRANVAKLDSPASSDIPFWNVNDGQTYTMYIHNAFGGQPTHTFRWTSGSSASEAGTGPGTGVLWGAEYAGVAPPIAAGKTNVYTFIRIDSGVFASAITGYDYAQG